MEQPVIREVSVQKKRILEAAKVSTHANECLRKLFPEVFAEAAIDLQKLKLKSGCYYPGDGFFECESLKDALGIDRQPMSVRTQNEYAGKAFWLSADFGWELKKDSANQLCLVITKKS